MPRAPKGYSARGIGNFEKELAMTQTATRKARRSRAPCVLTTESQYEFARFRKAVFEDLQPSGPLEQYYVDAAVALMWEISRLRRIKVEILNSAFFEALQKLLQQVMEGFQYDYQRDHAAEDLARRWFADQDVKAEVAELLDQHGLDETTVEAEAFRLRAESMHGVDLLLSAKEIALERALRFLGKLRKNLGERLRQRSKEILQSEPDPGDRLPQTSQEIPETEPDPDVPMLVESSKRTD
jgi:hypothetical protein